VVTTAVTIRRCAERALDDFQRFGSANHVSFCRGEFARGDDVEILVALDADDRLLGNLHLDLAAHASEEEARERGFATIELGVEDHNPAAPDPNPGVLMRKSIA
jgi:hypothetical protein